jgi:hypothetical protein
MITLWRKGMDWLQQNHYRAPWLWERCASRAVLTQLFMYCLVISVNSSFVCSINYINTKEGFKICKNSFVNNAELSVCLYPGISAEFHCAANKLASCPKRRVWSLWFIQSPTRWLASVLSRAVKKQEPEAGRSPNPTPKSK